MIKLDKISKSFDGKKILNNFSCSISDTGITAVRGASGSGKTTLARIIAGLETADNGKISGLENKKVSFQFQEDRLFPYMTALENASVASDTDTAKSILIRFGLENDLDKKPNELSGGMCRRVSLARALAYGGDILILDEPFKGLDSETKEIVFTAVKEFSKNSCVLLITHDGEDLVNADSVIEI